MTGLEIEGFPGQPYGNDCGIFMLMYALYTVLDAPYDFTITDMPALRKWWCLVLIENFDLGSHGKVFAHWTDKSKALLRGEVPPVFRLGKRKLDDIEEEEQLEAVQANSSLQKDEKATEEETWEKIVEHCKNAADWIQENPNLFAATVDLPDVLQMGEEETAKAVKQFARLWDEKLRETIEEDEREEILEPFKFVFQDMEEMLTFCEEIVDKRGYMAYCECRLNDDL